MAWTYLFFAGLFEIGWAIGLKYTHGFTRLVPTALSAGDQRKLSGKQPANIFCVLAVMPIRIPRDP